MSSLTEIAIDGRTHAIVGRPLQLTTGAWHGSTWRRFHVDHPDKPGVACAQHSLPQIAIEHILAGRWVRTSGHTYQKVDYAPN